MKCGLEVVLNDLYEENIHCGDKYYESENMFVILTYDINVKRNNKVRKLCRKYLQHVQKSVFEGYITEAKLKKLKTEWHKVCKTEEDSIIIYRFDSLKYSQREILGIYEQKDNFL